MNKLKKIVNAYYMNLYLVLKVNLIMLAAAIILILFLKIAGINIGALTSKGAFKMIPSTFLYFAFLDIGSMITVVIAFVINAIYNFRKTQKLFMKRSQLKHASNILAAAMLYFINIYIFMILTQV